LLTIEVKSDPATIVTVGSEGNIAVRDGEGCVIRELTAQQAHDIADALTTAARHAERVAALR